MGGVAGRQRNKVDKIKFCAVRYAAKFFNDCQVARVCASVCACVCISYYVIKINLMARFLIDAFAQKAAKQSNGTF